MVPNNKIWRLKAALNAAFGKRSRSIQSDDEIDFTQKTYSLYFRYPDYVSVCKATLIRSIGMRRHVLKFVSTVKGCKVRLFHLERDTRDRLDMFSILAIYSQVAAIVSEINNKNVLFFLHDFENGKGSAKRESSSLHREHVVEALEEIEIRKACVLCYTITHFVKIAALGNVPLYTYLSSMKKRRRVVLVVVVGVVEIRYV